MESRPPSPNLVRNSKNTSARRRSRRSTTSRSFILGSKFSARFGLDNVALSGRRSRSAQAACYGSPVCWTQSRRLKIYGAGDSTTVIEPDNPPFGREGVPVHECADGAGLLAPTRLGLHEIRRPHLGPYIVL